MKFRLTAASSIAFAVLGLAVGSANATAIYTFDSLSPGTLVGQDNWQNPFGFGISPTVGSGTGIDTTLIAQGTINGNGYLATRANDANFSFGHFSDSQTAVTARFDVFVPSLSSSGNSTVFFGFAHGTDDRCQSKLRV